MASFAHPAATAAASQLTVEGLDMNLQEALAAAIKAAEEAGRIIWEATQRCRAAVAAAYARTALPGKGSNDNNNAKANNEDNDNSTATADRDVEQQQQARLDAAVKAVSDLLGIETKDAPNDLVTLYDKRCDAVILKTLQRYVDGVNGTNSGSSAQPSSSEVKPTRHTFKFITEELSSDGELTDDLTWIVDPIDGTLSFVHGLPDCCVSIGLTYRKECILAVVFCPFLASGTTVGVMQASHAREGLTSTYYNVATAIGNGGGAAASGAGHTPQRNNNNNGGRSSSNGSTNSSSEGGGVPGNSATSTPPPPPALLSPHHSGAMRAIPQPPSPSASPTSVSTTSGGGGVGVGVGGGGGAHLPPPQQQQQQPVYGSDHAGVAECVGELYVAVKGRGCFANGFPVRVNTAAVKANAMAVFNFPHSVRLTEAEAAGPDAAAVRKEKMHRAIDAVVEIRRQMGLDMLPGVRAYGSCVTTLSLLAAGHLDLYVEPAGKVWDVVCGSLLVVEAGGWVKSMTGKRMDLGRDTTIAAGATEELVDYGIALCEKNNYRQFWLL